MKKANEIITLDSLTPEQKKAHENFLNTNNWYIPFIDLGRDLESWEGVEPNSLIQIYNAYLFAKEKLITENLPLSAELINQIHFLTDPKNKSLELAKIFQGLWNSASSLGEEYMGHIKNILDQWQKNGWMDQIDRKYYIDKADQKIQPSWTNTKVKDKLSIISNHYEDNIRLAGNPNEIGETIVALRQNSEVGHFFQDFNTRTQRIIMLVLLEKNKLLWNLEEDPTHISLCKKNENALDKFVDSQKKYLDFISEKFCIFDRSANHFDKKNLNNKIKTDFTSKFLEDMYCKENLAFKIQTGFIHFIGIYKILENFKEAWQIYALPLVPEVFPNSFWDWRDLEKKVKPALFSHLVKKTKSLQGEAPLMLIGTIFSNLDKLDSEQERSEAISLIGDWFNLDRIKDQQNYDLLEKGKFFIAYIKFKEFCSNLVSSAKKSIEECSQQLQLEYKVFHEIFSKKYLKKAVEKFVAEFEEKTKYIKIKIYNTRGEGEYPNSPEESGLFLEDTEKRNFQEKVALPENNFGIIFKRMHEASESMESIFSMNTIDNTISLEFENFKEVLGGGAFEYNS